MERRERGIGKNVRVVRERKNDKSDVLFWSFLFMLGSLTFAENREIKTKQNAKTLVEDSIAGMYKYQHICDTCACMNVSVSVCMCGCVCVRGTERERQKERKRLRESVCGTECETE